jgi:hypothetical protein
MISVLGNKLAMSHGLGQKSHTVGKKVLKTAITAGKVFGGGVAALGAIGAVAGFDKPGVKMVRQRGGLERAIRG